MKLLEQIRIENFRHSTLNDRHLIDDYDSLCLKKTNWYERPPVGFQFSKIKPISKPESSLFDFVLLDTNYSIPNSLKDLANEIIESKYIPDLDDDWDGMGAVQIPLLLYKAAIDFLLMYSVYIYKSDNKTIIQSPEINPVPNGSIDFSWTTNEARLLINVKYKKDKYIASCYGYSKISGLSIEGLVDMKNIDNDIASWMKKLKT